MAKQKVAMLTAGGLFLWTLRNTGEDTPTPDLSGEYMDGVVRIGVIATASLSNKWRNRRITQQTAINADLELRSDFTDFVTDNRILLNGLLGFGLEIGEHQFRFTNLFIRDSLKRGSLALGDDLQNGDTDLVQDTAWFERQLYNSQFVGEMEFGDLSVDLRGGYAQTQREAPYEWEFTYTRTNNAGDPLGELFLNTLDPQRGGAIVSLSRPMTNLPSRSPRQMPRT